MPSHQQTRNLISYFPLLAICKITSKLIVQILYHKLYLFHAKFGQVDSTSQTRQLLPSPVISFIAEIPNEIFENFVFLRQSIGKTELKTTG